MLFAIAFAVVAGYRGDLVLGTALAGAGLFFGVLQSTYTVPLSTHLLIGRVSALELARQVFTVAFIVVLVAAGAGLVLLSPCRCP